MTTLFISDLHLDAERPAAIDLFEQFLAQEGPRADRIYILGDLFEYWIGDDHETETSRRVAATLHRLSDSGVQIFFIAGNRDFLLGIEYARRCGMRLLSDPATILLNGQRTLISHGDALCIDDVEYQSFRARVREPAWQADFLAQSIEDRLAFARQARDESQASTQQKPEAIMDVNPGAVDELMARMDVPLLVHGHTHRPAVHELANGRQRIVLGDWYDQGSALWAREDGIELVSL
ncbi:MAG: UDP-2,3-diacylglucosamine diphosphatase [Xanthomonadales bacterium]|nr:UDP-2,3-diacylglucosamine diphosphatase [Xanthomonadales bacterium]